MLPSRLFMISPFVLMIATFFADGATNLDTVILADKEVETWSRWTNHHKSRMKRSERCDNPQRMPTLTPTGYDPLNEEDVSVKFVNNSNHYTAEVSWNTPTVNNGTPISAYFFWLVTDGQVQSCYLVRKMENLFIVNTKMGWKANSRLIFTIEPQPLKQYSLNYLRFSPHYDDANSNRTRLENPTRRTTTSQNTTNAAATTTSQPSPSTTFVKPLKENTKSKKIALIIGISAVVFLTLLLVPCVCFIRKKRRSRYVTKESDADAGKESFIYVSYCPENDAFTRKIVGFTSWFREQGYDAQMDILQSPRNEIELRQLGRLRFGERQLEKAKNVLMVISPGYLKLCNVDQNKQETVSTATDGCLSKQELHVFSEITQIRNELCSTMYRNRRFIPVLLDVHETELPFWIKEMVVYSWPQDKINNRLLFRLEEKVEYSLF